MSWHKCQPGLCCVGQGPRARRTYLGAILRVHRTRQSIVEAHVNNILETILRQTRGGQEIQIMIRGVNRCDIALLGNDSERSLTANWVEHPHQNQEWHQKGGGSQLDRSDNRRYQGSASEQMLNEPNSCASFELPICDSLQEFGHDQCEDDWE